MFVERPIKAILFIPIVAACLLLMNLGAATAEVTVRAIIEKQEVFKGESFVFQIQVQGSDNPEKPVLSGFDGFNVIDLGGSKNNSESVTIINGDVNRVVRQGFVFSYRLTPKKLGYLVIPAVNVVVGQKTYVTSEKQIKVNKPSTTEDFKLRMELSKTSCYVGEPVVLTVTWYIGKAVRGYEFTVPLLEEDKFVFDNPHLNMDPKTKYFRFSLPGGEVIAEKGSGFLEGRSFQTLAFKKIVIPMKVGEYELAPATVAFNALAGYRKSRSPFDSYFGGGRRSVYKTFVVSSNALVLNVKVLPEEGKPVGYSGHIGTYRIRTSAAPTEINVGDPITLTIRISGTAYLKALDLPSLENQENLARDFRIPVEAPVGKIAGGEKVFEQTIRASHSGVKEIPPIELAYFDTSTGKYGVARSAPIPLTVKTTRIVTARDAEGDKLTTVKTEVAQWQGGIAHNYADLSILEDQHYGVHTWINSPAWLTLILAPPFIYLVLLLSTTAIRRRRSDPDGLKARKAYKVFIYAMRALKKTTNGDSAALASEVEKRLRDYLGRKLRMPGGALTYDDVENLLARRSVRIDVLEGLNALFKHCDACRYAGSGSGGDSTELIQTAREVVGKIEKCLK